MTELAQAHQQGRRLYVGTTAAKTKRFVIWDIGAIACRGQPQDKQLIKQILLASSAIPGIFPPQHITVDLDGGPTSRESTGAKTPTNAGERA